MKLDLGDIRRYAAVKWCIRPLKIGKRWLHKPQ
jgi:hypothetical protein